MSTPVDYGAAVDRFLRLTDDPKKAQEETLGRILAGARNGRYGQQHGFAALDGPEAYRRAVPLATYEELRPWIESDPSSTTGEAPLSLLCTSASTGRSKWIPYTATFRESIRAAHDVFSAALFRDWPALPLGEHGARAVGLYQVSSSEQTFAGLPLDSYVSRLFDVALPEDPFFHALPRELFRVADARARLYAVLLCSAGWEDLRAIRATNPTSLLLFARLLAEVTPQLLVDLEVGRADAAPTVSDVVEPLLQPRPQLARRLAQLGRPLQPRDLWPKLELLVTWRGGACHLYEPHLLEHFGEVRLRAPIFAASEGVIAIPLADEMRGGVPALESSYLEFRPSGEEGPHTLGVHELEDDREYELILTSSSGLFRYLIGDLVKVDGRVGRCPTISFVARKGRTSSLTGEKLTEQQVEQAFAHVARRLGVSPLHFMLSAHFDSLPYYVLCIEWGQRRPPSHMALQLAVLMDQALEDINIEYRAKRASDRLGPVVALEVAPGEFERLQAAGLSRAGAANHKLSHLSRDPLHQQLRAAGS